MISYNNLRIGIPSYDKPQILVKKTLKYLLDETNIARDKIDIFVDNRQQQQLYKKYIPEDINIVVSNTKGKKNIENFIVSYYPSNTLYAHFNDDLTGIFQRFCSPKPHSKKLHKLREFLLDGFLKCKSENTILWGCNQLKNNLWGCSLPTFQIDIPFAQGGFFGFIVDKSIQVDSMFDDISRGAVVFEKYKKVLTLNRYYINEQVMRDVGGVNRQRKNMDMFKELKRLEKKHKVIEVKHKVMPDQQYPFDTKYDKAYIKQLQGGGLQNNKVVYAVPSYKRYKVLKDKTFKTLMSYNIPEKDIYVFVASKTELIEYKNEISADINWVVGVRFLHKQRNFISNYFPVGTKIVWLDDDITEITTLGDGKLNRLFNLSKFVDRAFALCEKENAYIWGVYPVDNHFFMKDTITTNLRYIVGAFYGTINRHDSDLKLYLEEKEDVLRTLQYYKKDGKVIRFNMIGIKTQYFGEGGMSVDRDRIKEGKTAVGVLNREFPNLTTIVQPTNTHPYFEVRLKDKG